ncbi:hypothetical protein CEXT_261181 [Caerostris extrusa]|uniref:Uncharacterized protein n=1 Tax=Caerostris extrusa TaxID=172846 RepID=A0AAV4U0C1_CAEEX|nr:hypothetical protein CEXT_261181 [Caerostris extrusa]
MEAQEGEEKPEPSVDQMSKGIVEMLNEFAINIGTHLFTPGRNDSSVKLQGSFLHTTKRGGLPQWIHPLCTRSGHLRSEDLRNRIKRPSSTSWARKFESGAMQGDWGRFMLYGRWSTVWSTFLPPHHVTSVPSFIPPFFFFRGGHALMRWNFHVREGLIFSERGHAARGWGWGFGKGIPPPFVPFPCPAEFAYLSKVPCRQKALLREINFISIFMQARGISNWKKEAREQRDRQRRGRCSSSHLLSTPSRILDRAHAGADSCVFFYGLQDAAGAGYITRMQIDAAVDHRWRVTSKTFFLHHHPTIL